MSCDHKVTRVWDGMAEGRGPDNPVNMKDLLQPRSQALICDREPGNKV